jgi:hypothetical protein
LCIIWFLSSKFHSLQCIVNLPPWLYLFLNVLRLL